MKKYSLVSVVIPTYNRTTVKDAIESVFCQNYKNIEIIVVDDCSEPAVSDILFPYLTRIIVIKHQSNKGVSAARNTGINNCTGEYIAFLDSDDIWLPEKLEKQLEFMEKEGTEICHTDEFWFKKDRYVNSGQKHLKYGGKIFGKILDKCRVSPSSFIIKKELLLKYGGFDEKLRVCEDYELFIRLSVKEKFSYLADKLIVKRAITNNSLSDSIQFIESVRYEILKNLKIKLNLDEMQRVCIEEEIYRKQNIVHRKN